MGVLTAAFLLAACSSFDPRPFDAIALQERAVTRKDAGLRVAVAIPTEEETRAIFGVDLARKGVQPVWFEIDNGSRQPVMFLELLVDPEYFSAYEVAYMFHRTFQGGLNRRIDDHFASLGIGELDFERGEKRSGFVFTTPQRGTKYMDLVFIGPEDLVEFPVPVPIIEGGGARLAGIEAGFRAEDRRDFHELSELLDALVDLPVSAKTRNDVSRGEPLNAVLVGAVLDLRLALLRTGWFEVPVAEEGEDAPAPPDRGYRPAAEVIAFGRPQDFALRKVRGDEHQPLGLNVWLTPLYYRGTNVFAASVTRDSELFGSADWRPREHSLDPQVDLARTFLSQDLLLSSRIGSFGFVGGVGAIAEPDAQLASHDSTYWTDGFRAVFLAAPGHVALGAIDFFDTTGAFALGRDPRAEDPR